MEKLREFLLGQYTSVKIDLTDNGWHTDAKIPDLAGWYFVTTDAPVEVISRQQLWATTYITKKKKVETRVKNYDLAARAGRYTDAMSRYWNITKVYSGIASSLRDRAREHTFADPGTGGLALSKYPALFAYDWTFNYRCLDQILPGIDDWEMQLRLGEQIWRSHNCWPLLCAE